MVMIMFHHFAFHGGFLWDSNTITLPECWYNLIIMGGKIGVDIFVLISGYFLINSKVSVFNLKRVLKFWGQVLFYSIAILIVFGCLGYATLNLKEIIKSFLPISLSSWWFASTYFVLYILHPFLNKLLKNLDKKMYQSLLVILILGWSILPTFTTFSYQSSSLTWFITLYAVAGYAKLYGFNNSFTAKHYFIFWLVFTVLTYSSSVVFAFLGTKYEVFFNHMTYFYGMERISVLLISLTLFLAFTKLSIKYNKFINIIASATFGVYLIHDSNIIRPFLWITVFKNAQYQNSLMLIPYSLGVVALVYLLCTLIDLLRQQIFEKPYLLLVNKVSDKIEYLFNVICDFFKNIVFGK